MSKPKSIEEIAETFRNSIWENTRRSIAVHRMFPWCYVRFRRAAKAADETPNANLFLVFILGPSEVKPRMEIIPVERLDAEAKKVTDVEVADWLSEKLWESED